MRSWIKQCFELGYVAIMPLNKLMSSRFFFVVKSRCMSYRQEWDTQSDSACPDNEFSYNKYISQDRRIKSKFCWELSNALNFPKRF